MPCRSNAPADPGHALHLPAGGACHGGGLRPGERPRRRCAARSSASPASCCRRCATGSTADRLELLIVENAWAIPMHLPLGVALRRLVEETGIPTIGHHHDYWWERERFASLVVPEVLEAAFPPDLPTVRHVSINSLAAAELRERRGIESMVDPQRLRLRPAAAARADDCSRSDAPRARDGRRTTCSSSSRRGSCRARASSWRSSWSAGSTIRELSAAHHQPGRRRGARVPGPSSSVLADRARRATCATPRIASSPITMAPRSAGPHAVTDAYLAADLITYPSLYEGFGNALIEAIYHGKPVVVNRYPVYVADIAPLGMRPDRDRRRHHRRDRRRGAGAVLRIPSSPARAMRAPQLRDRAASTSRTSSCDADLRGSSTAPGRPRACEPSRRSGRRSGRGPPRGRPRGSRCRR